MNDSSKNPGKISPCPRCIEENNVYIVLENGKESDWVCPRCGHEYWNVTPPFLHDIGWKEEDERTNERRQATRQTEIKHQGNKSLTRLQDCQAFYVARNGGRDGKR